MFFCDIILKKIDILLNHLSLSKNIYLLWTNLKISILVTKAKFPENISHFFYTFPALNKEEIIVAT